MSWELQSHMHEYVAPSIDKAAQAKADPILWLAHRFADQRWDEDTGEAGYDALVEQALGLPDESILLEAVAEFAIENGSTTNGGHEVYLDDCTSVAWCTEDELLAWQS